MTLSLPIQLWRPGLAPGVYEKRGPASVPALVRLDRAVFIGLAERGPLHTAVDVADWATFERLFGRAVPGMLLPEAVRLFFANGGRRCLVVRCLNHAASQTRLLALPGLTTLPQFPACPKSDPAPMLAARNPGAWASGLRLRLSLQQPPAPLELAPSATGVFCHLNDLQIGDSLRLLAPRPQLPQGMPAPPPLLVRVTGLEPAAASVSQDRGAQIVHLDPSPDPSFLTEDLLLQARRLELTLEVWLDGRMVERWAQAALHPDHPRFLPRLLGRRAASEEFRPARVSTSDPESPASEVDRLWGATREPWGSEFIRPSRRLLERSLVPESELLERGEQWDLPLGDPREPHWSRLWQNDLDQDGAEQLRREHFFAATPAAPTSDQDDQVLVFADRPGTLEPGGAIDRWDECHPFEPAALFCLPDLLHPSSPDPQRSKAVPSPERCFSARCEPLPEVSSAPARGFPRLRDQLDDLHENQRRLVQACEQRQQGIALLDLPLRLVANQPVPLRTAERAAWVAALRSARAALYTPWLQTQTSSGVVTLGPAAVAAGLIARSERLHGVWRAPGNGVAQGVFATAERIGEELAGALHEERINAFRTQPAGLTLLGTRTSSTDSDWTHLSVRRLIDWLKLQIAADLAWAPFEPNGEALWDAMAGTAQRRLRQVFDAGGLAGETEAESFFVRCDASTTSHAERDHGRVVLLVGVAPSLPTEFLVFQLLRRGGEDAGLEVI